jgi:hypothetical protein
MKSFDIDEERRLQGLAEAAERSGAATSADADIEAYRRVIRAAARPLDVALPAGFAAGIAARVEAPADVGLLERLGPGIGLVVIGAVGIMSSGRLLLDAGRLVGELGVDRLPWPMLTAAGLALAAVGLWDRALIASRRVDPS